jgi:LDH2 family malate/lactate/ureidoglycolate dehydrogenase
VYGNLFQRANMAERQHHDVGHFMAAIDPSRFRPLDEFKRDMDDMFRALKSSPPAEGQQRIYVAGEPEAETERRRRVEGIPLAPALVRQVNDIAAPLRVAPLA